MKKIGYKVLVILLLVALVALIVIVEFIAPYAIVMP